MNKLDLLFVVDVTGSMGNFISDAQHRMKGILDDLTKEYELDMRVGLSLYRDHPPQDNSFATATYKLSKIDDIKIIIDQITVDGGGDIPECVLDGIYDGVTNAKWRKNSKRVAFLIGDAPVHGMMSQEDCCQCGMIWGTAVEALESNEVTLYSILLSSNVEAQDHFRKLAIYSGGTFIKATDAIAAIFNTLKTELEDYIIKR